MTALRVLVVSPLPAIRAGLHAMLQGADGIGTVAEASPEDLAAGIELEPFDVAVVDAGGGGDHAGWPLAGVPAVTLVDPGEPGGVVGAARPAGGWLPRGASAEEIAAAVGAVAQGLVVVHPALARELLPARPLHDDAAGAEPLTEREREVLDLVARGLPNKAIAVQLGISEHTVKFHVSAILAKLGVSARTEAVTTALRRGLLAL